MRNAGWILLLVITAFAATMLTLTFMQPAFRQEVSVSIVFFKTREFPVYCYVLAALAVGLLLGVFPMLLLYIRAKREVFRRGKRIRELERGMEPEGRSQESGAGSQEKE
jgi:hypothetical protein